MVQFKKEFLYSKILIKTQSLGRIELNTENADPEKWANVPELAFMFEDVQPIESKTAKIKEVIVNAPEENAQENEAKSIDDFTKKEIEKILNEKGIEFLKKATKTELFNLMINS